MTDEREKDESKVPGGLARAKALTPERKSQIAAKAAAARWGKLPSATHRGNFKEDFGIDVDCYVLDDEQKTAVLSQRGMGAAMGLQGASGQAFLRFANSRTLAPYVGLELREKIENPLVFQWRTSGPQQELAKVIHGYDVTLLVDFCKAILAAEAAGQLLPRQAKMAQQARIILNASAKAGIKGLVYALAGYDATREEIITAFKFYVREEAREYEKEFPDHLYAEWYRLYELPRPERNKPWKFKHLTVNQVYHPLARSSGKVYELTQAQRAKTGKRHDRLHQFLSEIGVKALRQHLGQLLGIARIAKDRLEYEGYFQRLFGQQPGLFDLENNSFEE
jgi:P63C domain